MKVVLPSCTWQSVSLELKLQSYSGLLWSPCTFWSHICSNEQSERSNENLNMDLLSSSENQTWFILSLCFSQTGMKQQQRWGSCYEARRQSLLFNIVFIDKQLFTSISRHSSLTIVHSSIFSGSCAQRWFCLLLDIGWGFKQRGLCF